MSSCEKQASERVAGRSDRDVDPSSGAVAAASVFGRPSLLQPFNLEGQVLDGRYAIVRRIADGGMSTVYLGKNQRIGKDVAIKVLHPTVAQDQDLVERFEREARIVSRIRSAHVADVYDFGELPEGSRFMVMEYLDGESLATRLEREQTLEARLVATIADQILVALSAAHRVGVVHRDLKPENVILEAYEDEITVKVVDFGISKILRGDGHANANVKMTAFNSVLGTPLYMSPEQARGNTALIDERSDIYSLGVILYEATAGEPPLTGDNVNDLLFRVALEDPTPLATRVPSVDPTFAAIVTKAMAKSPGDRYQSVDEMRDAIAEWLLAAPRCGETDTEGRIGARPEVGSGWFGRSSKFVMDAQRAFGPPAYTPLPSSSVVTGRLESTCIPPRAPAAVTVAAEPRTVRADGPSLAGVERGRSKQVRGMAIAVPLVGLLLLGAPSARNALVEHEQQQRASEIPQVRPPVLETPVPAGSSSAFHALGDAGTFVMAAPIQKTAPPAKSATARPRARESALRFR